MLFGYNFSKYEANLIKDDAATNLSQARLDHMFRKKAQTQSLF